MLFINTRPKDRATALTTQLRQSNFSVIELPVLELRALPLDERLKALYQELKDTQIIVVVSPTAVEVGIRYLLRLGYSIQDLSHIEWVAVGKTTATALKEMGIHSHIPEIETSEGMLSLDIFKKITAHQKIAFWRGEGGRQFMMQQCQQQQLEVLNFLLYERYCPEGSCQIFDSFVEESIRYETPYWVCISSEASWKNWRMLAQDSLGIVGKCHYLVLGERLFKLLNDEQKNLGMQFGITRLDHLDPQLIVEKIQGLTKEL